LCPLGFFIVLRFLRLQPYNSAHARPTFGLQDGLEIRPWIKTRHLRYPAASKMAPVPPHRRSSAILVRIVPCLRRSELQKVPERFLDSPWSNFGGTERSHYRLIRDPSSRSADVVLAVFSTGIKYPQLIRVRGHTHDFPSRLQKNCVGVSRNLIALESVESRAKTAWEWKCNPVVQQTLGARIRDNQSEPILWVKINGTA
jgi:hypothetical protein